VSCGSKWSLWRRTLEVILVDMGRPSKADPDGCWRPYEEDGAPLRLTSRCADAGEARYPRFE
jgi:hypothetical protein